MAKPNYRFAKKQRELAKKQRKVEKQQQRHAGRAAPEASTDENAVQPTDTDTRAENPTGEPKDSHLHE